MLTTPQSLGPDDELVKTIGDGALLVSRTPADAVGLAERLVIALAGEHDFPDVRRARSPTPQRLGAFMWRAWDEAVVDPVCHMRIDPRAAVGEMRHDGRAHWFCSLECAGSFAANPDRYLGR